MVMVRRRMPRGGTLCGAPSKQRTDGRGGVNRGRDDNGDSPMWCAFQVAVLSQLPPACPCRTLASRLQPADDSPP